MGALELILIIVLVLLVLGGVPAWNRRADYGYGPGGVIGLLLVVVLVVLLFRVL